MFVMACLLVQLPQPGPLYALGLFSTLAIYAGLYYWTDGGTRGVWR